MEQETSRKVSSSCTYETNTTSIMNRRGIFSSTDDDQQWHAKCCKHIKVAVIEINTEKCNKSKEGGKITKKTQISMNAIIFWEHLKTTAISGKLRNGWKGTQRFIIIIRDLYIHRVSSPKSHKSLSSCNIGVPVWVLRTNEMQPKIQLLTQQQDPRNWLELIMMEYKSVSRQNGVVLFIQLLKSQKLVEAQGHSRHFVTCSNLQIFTSNQSFD